MPNQSLTEIAVILDRSGSMASIREDMIGGFAHFFAEQRKVDAPCVASVYQFDNHFDVVFEEKPLAEIESLVLEPRGGTALLDAVGRAIGLIGRRLKAKPDADRPGSVVVLVITDGHENASGEFTRDQIKKMIEHQREKYDWQFAFLGANVDSFAEGRSMGFDGAAVMDYMPSGMGVNAMSDKLSKGVGAYRSGKEALIRSARRSGPGGSSVELSSADFRAVKLNLSDDEKKP